MLIQTMRFRLSQAHIAFSFIEDPGNSQTGSWVVQLRDEALGQYVTMTPTSLRDVFLKAAFPGKQAEGAFMRYVDRESLTLCAYLRESFGSLGDCPVSFDASGLTARGPRGQIARPFFIVMDDEQKVEEYFLKSRAWTAREDKERPPTCDELRATYKKKIHYERLQGPEKEQSDLFMDTHFIPLFEQLIEFELSQGAVPRLRGSRVLKTWTEPRRR